MPSPEERADAGLEDRVNRLEEALFFQEETIRQLNDALTAQQIQMDLQQKQLAAAELRLKTLWRLLNDEGGELTVPPHYL